MVDISSPCIEEHIQAVETILSELSLDDIPRLVVLNKMDLVSPEDAANLARMYQAVAITAQDRNTLPPLIERMQESLLEQLAAMPA